MSILAAVDVLLLYYAASVTYTKGPSMMILFGFEALLLIFAIVSSKIKFIVNVIDSRQQVSSCLLKKHLLDSSSTIPPESMGEKRIFFAPSRVHYGCLPIRRLPHLLRHHHDLLRPTSAHHKERIHIVQRHQTERRHSLSVQDGHCQHERKVSLSLSLSLSLFLSPLSVVLISHQPK